MTSKYTISVKQAILLILLINVSTVIFYIPGGVAAMVGQDAWLAVIIGTILTGLLVFYPLVSLGMKYPNKSIIQYSNDILGKPFGKLIGLLFIYYFFQLHCWTVREFSELAIIILPETPGIVFVIIMSILTAYAVRSGLEVMARCSEFVFPIGLFLLTLIILLSIPEMSYDKFRPVFEFSIPEILLAGITPLDWLSVGFVFGMFAFSITNSHENIGKVALISLVLSGTILLIFTIATTAVFGSNLLENSNFSLLMLAKYVSIGSILERIEAVVVMYWISWVFVRASICSYITVWGLKEIFNLKDYKFLVIPETILAIAYSNFQYENFVEQFYLFTYAHFYYIFFSVGLPFFLWSVSLVRSKLRT